MELPENSETVKHPVCSEANAAKDCGLCGGVVDPVCLCMAMVSALRGMPVHPK